MKVIDDILQRKMKMLNTPCLNSRERMTRLTIIGLIFLAVCCISHHTLAFSPTVHTTTRSKFIYGNRKGCSSAYDVCLFASASDEDTNNDNIMDENNGQNNDQDDEDEVDIITQRLRRNAEKGPICPVKEHDKMKKENEDESTLPAALYSHLVANVVIDKDFDPDVSADEAYVESQFKELLSRKGEELARLGPGIATLPLDPNSNEAIAEKELAKKEAELQQLASEAKAAGKEAKWDESNLEESSIKQTEVLEKANKLQAEIDQLHIDDCGAVLLANLGFYEAFSLQDEPMMRDIWWQSPGVMCIHPSQPPLIGSNAVFESFKAMFLNSMKAGARVRDGGKPAGSGGVFMTPTNIRGLTVRATTASLVCDEEVYSKGTAGESSGRQGGMLVNKLLTTNVFRKIGGKWKMVHRHASWHPETTAAHEAKKAEPGIVLYDEKENNARSLSSRISKSKGLTLRKMNGDGTSSRPLASPSIPSSLEGMDTNAILGVPLPKEEEKKNPKPPGEEGMIGKIINLSDLLGGGSGDGDKDPGDEAISDVLSDLLGGDSDSTTGSGTHEDPFITKKIFKVGPSGVEDVTGGKKNKKSSDAEDEDKEAVIDLRNKSEDERREVLSQFVDNVMKDATSDIEEMKSSAVDATVSPKTSPEVKETLRQKCIATLRKLTDDGLISSKQKTILLTDIITASANGQTSMIEVAYELLCTDGSEDNHPGMEDFTQQCIVFAEEDIH